jgi:hypothetical protein
MGMLAIARTEYSWSDFWAIAAGADGVGVTGSFVSGVAKEETVRDRSFLRSASRFSVKFVGKLNQTNTILFSSTIGENKQSYLVMSNGYYKCILS